MELLAGARAAAGRPPRAELAAFLPARLVVADAIQLRRSGDAAPAAAVVPAHRPPTALLGFLWAWATRRP